jgi:8-oxo-dGTP diphosphatase
MKKEKFTMPVAVNLILIKDGKALMLRRENSGWHDGEYSVVAGHVDGRETIAAATVREAKEEAGIDIKEEDIRVLHVQHRINPTVEYIDFSVTADKWTGEPQNLEPDKCSDLSWFPIDNLPENTIPYIRNVFENIRNGLPFSEWQE